MLKLTKYEAVTNVNALDNTYVNTGANPTAGELR